MKKLCLFVFCAALLLQACDDKKSLSENKADTTAVTPAAPTAAPKSKSDTGHFQMMTLSLTTLKNNFRLRKNLSFVFSTINGSNGKTAAATFFYADPPAADGTPGRVFGGNDIRSDFTNADAGMNGNYVLCPEPQCPFPNFNFNFKDKSAGALKSSDLEAMSKQYVKNIQAEILKPVRIITVDQADIIKYYKDYVNISFIPVVDSAGVFDVLVALTNDQGSVEIAKFASRLPKPTGYPRYCNSSYEAKTCDIPALGYPIAAPPNGR